MLDYAAMEQALRAWILKGSGLDDAKILTFGAKTPQPQQPYIRFRINPPKRIGMDEERWSEVATDPVGSELQLDLAGQRELIVSVQCFSKQIDGGTDIDGGLSAKQLLSQCITVLALPDVRDQLNGSGLVFVDVASFNDFSEPMGPLGAGRAVLDIRFRAVDSASQTGSYIQNVNPTGTYS